MPVNDELGRLGETNINYQGCEMTIIKYVNANNITVEFKDKYRYKKISAYKEFKLGKIKNPYFPEVYGVGMYGAKYRCGVNNADTKEYKIWHGMLQRCYEPKTQSKQPTYKDCYVCEEWLLFDNFYEWLHKQENFKKWIECHRWTIDKDILCKGNKIYSPNTCCLIPEKINCLFTKRQNDRGEYPIGVYYYKRGENFRAQCMDPILNKRVLIGSFDNPEDAFIAYKNYKEKLIKNIAREEYDKGNITKPCFEAMLKYKVENTD